MAVEDTVDCRLHSAAVARSVYLRIELNCQICERERAKIDDNMTTSRIKISGPVIRSTIHPLNSDFRLPQPISHLPPVLTRS